ncbi:MAG: S8 family serine peptidase [Myxococcota bacterium]
MLLLLTQALLAAPLVSPEVVLAGKRYALTPVAEPVIVRSSVAPRLDAEDGVATRVLDDFTIVEGTRSAARLMEMLALQGEVVEVLAVFETQDGTRLYADRKVRVRFGDHVGDARRREIVRRAGAVMSRVVSSSRNTFEILAATPEESIEVARLLSESAEVRWAHPDFIVRASLEFAPNDALFPQQWHHDVLNSRAAWDIGQGAPSMIISILDSGVDVTHPDLADKIVSPRDTLRQTDTAEPAANDAHGTACAGIAAASTNNAEGIAGVCPACSILPVRLLDQNGFTRVSAGADGIRWAVDHGARVLSNSWGIAPVSTELGEALDEAKAAGVLVLFASGNSGELIPDAQVAAHPAVNAIGATNHYDLLAAYSNTGPHIVLTAPAAEVVTDIADRRGYTSGAYYAAFAGTSASTPVVAGIAGLVWSENPGLSAAQVLQILRDGADRIGSQAYPDGRNDLYGAGRVNAYRAMRVAAGLTPCVPSFELCGNAADDDCDGLIDKLDPQCAPGSAPIGEACTRDFQCSVLGYCLESNLGFPSGYCSQGCEGSGSACPSGSICVGEGFTTGSSCHVACADHGDCRTGYQCLPLTSGSAVKACLPSCVLSPCLAGETCNTETGVCEHDGASATGEACTTRVDCADNGRCLPDNQGYRDGMCVTECQDDGVCPAGTACVQLGVGQAFCMPTCTLPEDCREYYACHPIRGTQATATVRGYCWTACLSASDCGYETCNEYGLCGNETPPDITTKPGDDDPEASEEGGCAAISAEPLALLLLSVLRRRRPTQAA